MQMGNHLVQQGQAVCAAENSGHGDEQTALTAVLQRGKNQTNDGGSQHHPCGEGQNDVAEGVGDFFKGKA